MGESRATVCIIGAAGFVGQRLVRRLSHRPHLSLRALLHHRPVVMPPDAIRVAGSVDDPRALATLLIPGAVVVNLVSMSEDAGLAERKARVLADGCAAAGVARLVHVSTAVVAGDAAGRLIDEATPCRPRTAYERAKLRTEFVLIERARGAFDLVILRPTAVFGPGGRNLQTLVQRLRTGAWPARYLRACVMGRRRMHVVDVETVAAAIEFVALSPASVPPGVFIVSDDDETANNYRDLEDALAARLQVPAYPLPVLALPAGVLRAVLRLAGRPGGDPDRIYSADRLRSLGFTRPRSFVSALDEFAAGAGAPR